MIARKLELDKKYQNSQHLQNLYPSSPEMHALHLSLSENIQDVCLTDYF